ncbi:MAG TPA: hypothetical protein VJ501_15885 [Burkholderiaceae bacterium]|nr:hypothetical protein [Burkholderiaceae bacterium]
MQRFVLDDERAFVVPAESLTHEGLDPAWADLLRGSGRVSAAQMECLVAGFQLYWGRCRDLYSRAPRSWFAPRQTNLVIFERAEGAPPYYAPFLGTSSMLYMSDLDTHPEYVAALLVHIERLSLLHLVPATIAYNLSYWFDRDAESRSHFAAAARNAHRPDAAAFIALADSFDWIDELLHDPLRPPGESGAEPCIHVEGADLYVPKRLRDPFMALGQSAESAVRGAMELSASVVAASPAAPAAVDDLCDWLVEARAHVIVHGPHGGTLWSPDHDDPIRVRRMLAEASEEVVASIHGDLRIVDERSRQFLGRVRDIEALPKHCAVLETGGGAYVDAARRAVVYELKQQAFDASAVAAPPYHRLLLGARIMHEWGHVAHTANLIRIADEHRSDYTEARSELGEVFLRVVRSMPAQLQGAVSEELRSIEPVSAEWPKALARMPLRRVGDYLANLLCSRLIPGEEMQAYVRTNVRHHLDENLGLVSELSLYAYETQYLHLAGLPRSYFYRTSRFPDHFIATGVVSEQDVEKLFDAVGRVLACYSIDESRLSMAA